MKLTTFSILLLVFLIGTGMADEVYLKNGEAWFNVNVLEGEETTTTLTIWTSKGKKIVLQKEDTIGYNSSRFKTHMASELKIYDGELPATVTMINADSMAEERTAPDLAINPQNSEIGTLLNDVDVEDKVMAGLPKSRISFSGGYARRTTKLPDGLNSFEEDYLGALKSGKALAGSASIFPWGKYGISLTHSRFISSNSAQDLSLELENGIVVSAEVEDNITISFWGVGFSQRSYFDAKKIMVVGNISLGVVNLDNNGSIRISDNGTTETLDATISGSTFGGHFDISVERFLTPNIAIGGSLSLLGASIKEVELNGQTLTSEDGEELSYINLNLGLQLYF
ncbi:MAG: hypothetical protein ACRBF0_03995 [Calditrichia bacterium]